MKKTAIFIGLALMLSVLVLIPHPNVFAQTNNDTQDIKILNYSYYIDSSGTLLDVVGEVQNIGTSNLANVTIGASIFDAFGQDQGDSSGPAYTIYMVPQEKVPFDISFTVPYSTSYSSWFTVDITNITLVVIAADPTTSYQYPDLTVLNSQGAVSSGSTDKGTYWVTGTIQNTGNQTADQVQVVGTFYNSSGTTVAVGYSNTLSPANLNPSSTESFQVGAFDLNMTTVPASQQITSYSLKIHCTDPVMDGIAPPLTDTATSTGSTQNSQSTKSTGVPTPSPTSNSSQNNSSGNALLTRVIVIAVIAAAILVVAVVTLRTRKSKAQTTRKQAVKAKRAD